MSSDSTLNVNLSYSSFITDPTIRYVSDAQVFITNLNTQEEYKLEHDRNGNYLTDVVAYKSYDYALSVITFDGNEMTSETSVPRDILVDVSIDTLYDINSDFSELSIDVAITSDTNTDNFYTFEVFPYQKRLIHEDSIKGGDPKEQLELQAAERPIQAVDCLLYTSPSPRD